MIKGIRKSLTLKWTIFSVLLATIPLTIAGLNIIQIYQKDLKESVIKIKKEKAQVIVERTEAFFEKMTEHLLFLAREKQVRRFGPSHAKEHLENFLNQTDYFSELTFLDEKGREYAKVSKYKVVNLSDLRDESKSEMFEVASKGQIFYKDFVTTESIFPSMIVAVPVGKYAGKPVGVLSAKIHIRYLLDLIPQRLMEEMSSAYLVGKGGFLLAHPDTSGILLGPFVDRAIAGEEGGLELENLRGKRFLVVYKPIRKLGWGIVVQVPVEEVYKPLKQIYNTAIQWILIALTVAVILGFLLANKLTLPVKRLSKEMGEVAKGDLDAHIQVTSQDEIGHLTESFNQMIQSLKQAQVELKEAEAKYRRIFENSKDMVYITSVNGRFIDVNQAGVEMFGYASKEELMRIHVKDAYLNPEDRNRFMREITERGFAKDYEVQLKKKDGTPIDVFITATVRRDEEGQIIGYEGIIKDISDRKRMEEELVQSTKELQALYDLSKLINQSLGLNEVLSIALDKVMELTGFEMGGIYLLQEDEVFEFKYHRGFGPRFVENVRFLKFGEGVCGKAVELRQPVSLSIEEYPTPHILPFLREEGIQSLISFPLLAKEKPIGAINLASCSSHFLAPKEINLLGSLGNQIGLALENVRLFEETKKRLDELTILYEITKMSTSSFNLDRMLTEIVNSLNNVFKFEAFGILLVDEMTRKLVPHASYKGLPIENIEKLGLCVGKGITGWVAEKGEPLLVNNVKQDPRYISNGEAILSEMCAPLKVGMKVIGVIDAQSRELNAFSENDLRLLNIASGQIATTIENIRLHEEIKQSEERYRTVVEGAHDGVCVIGRDFRFKYVNQRITEIHGYAQEELIGMDFRELLDEESSKLLDDRFVRWRRGERLSSLFELKIFRKDGEIRNVEISARAIKDSKGNVNFVCFVKDITEKRKMEDQLLQNEKLRALGEMASGVAHDFNNALAAILGNTQLLLHTVKDEEIRESLQVIEKVARDSAQTVRRLQDFTRRRIHQELFRLDVNSVVKDAIEVTKPKWKDEAQGRGVYIDMVTNFEKIPPVLGNGSEMREVITNMIFNAIEAMPEGGKIEIQTFQRREKVYVKISDTGIGMSEEVRKKIFEPFFTTKPFSNTGLGLSMSYGIVKRFGGEIEVESKVGKGTTLTILLPIASEGKEEPVSRSFVQKGREARILVIDDEETVRSVLSRILFQNNHQVTVAEDGEEGIRLFKEKGFDMVLTDLGMPGMSGWEVCRAIKKISPHTPVGMITGWGGEVDQAKIEESGIDFVIPKPFQFDQILKVVDDTIASREKPLTG